MATETLEGAEAVETAVDAPAPEEPEEEPTEDLEEPERVPRFGDPRDAVVDIIGKRLDRMLQPIDDDEVWHGVQVVTRKDLAEALTATLPPASIFAASVRTPAYIYVDAVCPVCGIAGEITLEVEAKLTATAHGRKLALAAKATALPHQCGQQRLRDLGPSRPVAGQTTLALGEETDVDQLDVETADGAPGFADRDDDEDLRPTGEVNADELRGVADRESADPDLLPF